MTDGSSDRFEEADVIRPEPPKVIIDKQAKIVPSDEPLETTEPSATTMPYDADEVPTGKPTAFDRWAFPNVWLGLVFIALLIPAVTASSFPAVFLMLLSSEVTWSVSPAVTNILLAVGTTIAMVPFIIVAWRIIARPFRELFKLQRFHLYWLPPLIILTCGARMLVNEIDKLTRILVPLSFDASDKVMTTILSEPISAALLLVILVPVMEEFIFRGILLRGLLLRWPARYAILIASVIFGVYHMNLLQIIPATLVGLILGYLYVASRSLWVPIICHMLFNSFALTKWFGNAESVELQSVSYNAISVGLLIGGIIVAWFTQRCTEQVETVDEAPK